MHRCHGFLWIACIAALVLPEPSGAARIVWSDIGLAGQIRSADLDGNDVTFIAEDTAAEGLVVDADAGHVYWTDFALNGIYRANLDGSGQTLLTTSSDPIGLAIDTAGGHLYWADAVTDQIVRANLDGSGATPLYGGVAFGPDIELDVAGGYVYWTDIDAGVFRATLDGLGTPQLLAASDDAEGLALDLDAGRLYWMDGSINTANEWIMSANLDGSDPTQVFQIFQTVGNGLEIFHDRLFWSEGFGSGLIASANFDGSDAQVHITGLDFPYAFAVVPEPGIGVLLMGGLVAFAGRRRRARRG